VFYSVCSLTLLYLTIVPVFSESIMHVVNHKVFSSKMHDSWRASDPDSASQIAFVADPYFVTCSARQSLDSGYQDSVTIREYVRSHAPRSGVRRHTRLAKECDTGAGEKASQRYLRDLYDWISWNI
jgi:hypothetical protein